MLTEEAGRERELATLELSAGEAGRDDEKPPGRSEGEETSSSGGTVKWASSCHVRHVYSEVGHE